MSRGTVTANVTGYASTRSARTRYRGRRFDSPLPPVYNPYPGADMAETGKKKYGKGALIYIESDEESDDVFVLETGEVELTGTPGLPRFRSLLGPGDIFGFTSCLCRRPRMETAIARTDCMCAVLERERFIESVEANPEVAGRIISYFAQELRAFDEMVVSPSEEASVSDDETRLYELAEYYQKKRKEAHARHALGRLPAPISGRVTRRRGRGAYRLAHGHGWPPGRAGHARSLQGVRRPADDLLRV